MDAFNHIIYKAHFCISKGITNSATQRVLWKWQQSWMPQNKYLPVFLIESNFIELILIFVAGKSISKQTAVMQLHCKDWNLCVLSRYIAMSCWEISDPGIHVAATACIPSLNVVLDQAHTTMLKFQYLVSPFCLVVLVLTNTLNTYR